MSINFKGEHIKMSTSNIHRMMGIAIGMMIVIMLFNSLFIPSAKADHETVDYDASNIEVVVSDISSETLPLLDDTDISTDIEEHSSYKIENLEYVETGITVETLEYKPQMVSEVAENIEIEETKEIEEEEEENSREPGEYTYGIKTIPAIDIEEICDLSTPRNYTEEVDVSSYEFVGTKYITGYDPYCYHCCGSTSGLTASGVEAQINYTVAAGSKYPLGTTLYIEGYGYYVVEDRGVGNNTIDIACDSHASCYTVTNRSVNVYIVPND